MNRLLGLICKVRGHRWRRYAWAKWCDRCGYTTREGTPEEWAAGPVH